MSEIIWQIKGKNMKVITIKQPWATLIAKGYKEYEYTAKGEWKVCQLK